MLRPPFNRYVGTNWALRDSAPRLSEVEKALIAAGSGYVWDSYLCPMYQTTDTSTPVVVNGDPIGRIDEYYAGVHNLLQSTVGVKGSYLSASRAIQLASDWLQASGIDADLAAGVNVLMHCQSDITVGTGTNQIYFAGQQTSGAVNRPVLLNSTSTTLIKPPMPPTGGTNASWAGGLLTPWRTLRTRDADGAGEGKIYENGVEKAAGNVASAAFTMNDFTLGAINAGVTPHTDLKVTFIGVFPLATVTDAQVAAIDAALVAERN